MKPSRWYYGLAILVFIGGVVSFALFLHKNLNSLSNSLTQVVMPGKWDITLPMTGKYTIFYEYCSLAGNRVFLQNKVCQIYNVYLHPRPQTHN